MDNYYGDNILKLELEENVSDFYKLYGSYYEDFLTSKLQFGTIVTIVSNKVKKFLSKSPLKKTPFSWTKE